MPEPKPVEQDAEGEAKEKTEDDQVKLESGGEDYEDDYSQPDQSEPKGLSMSPA